jgi:hypothetical protein
MSRTNPVPSTMALLAPEVTSAGTERNAERANRVSGKTIEYLPLRNTVKTLKRLLAYPLATQANTIEIKSEMMATDWSRREFTRRLIRRLSGGAERKSKTMAAHKVITPSMNVRGSLVTVRNKVSEGEAVMPSLNQMIRTWIPLMMKGER